MLQRRQVNRPTFFILGAPKCGTTALARWLSEHPNVFFPARKEPHFFNVDGLVATATLRQYEALFANARECHSAIGEGSTHYLYSREAVGRILDYQPDALFIVCLRSPVDMAPALHRERLKQGRETERSFEKAWRLQPLRAAGHRVPRTIRSDPDRLQYGGYCKLAEQLERLYDRAGRERVLPILLDDTRADAPRAYQRVLTFLGLPDDGRRRFSVINPSRHTRSPRLALLAREAGRIKSDLGLQRRLGLIRIIRSFNTKVAPKEPLPGALRRELTDFFASDVRKLESLLGRDLSSWLQRDNSINHDEPVR